MEPLFLKSITHEKFFGDVDVEMNIIIGCLAIKLGIIGEYQLTRMVYRLLQTVFSINLAYRPIREGEYENFTFSFTYKGYDMNISITSTEKNKQLGYGEGGHV